MFKLTQYSHFRKSSHFSKKLLEIPKVRSRMAWKGFQRSSRSPATPSESSGDNRQSTEGSSAPIPFPIGIKVLYECPDATVDICFVHGLTGNRESTWTAAGQSEPWPKTLLPSEIRNARILTYGYDAYVVRGSVASNNRLKDHACNLVNALTADRASIKSPTRALIFVAHSLGGLVCKKALLLSQYSGEAHLRGIYECTKAIIFMGTPHEGSWMARWATIPAKCLGIIKSTNTKLLDILDRDNEMLKEIQDEFYTLIGSSRTNGRNIKVTCFYEEQGLSVVGTVVPKDSATLKGYHPISIHANHRDMVKFASSEDQGFRDLCGELVRWSNEIKEEIAKDLADQQQQQQKLQQQPGGGNNRYGNTSSSPSTENAKSGHYHIGQVYNSGGGHQFPAAHFHGNVNF
ncbi:uncharacterized protein BHQ10_006162 [Talaromyces amestolkiae]|uniref:DUF676 domain-containing protein n=1 Tax=Talaromyces amestolkiae TaxID=1196081 RepID=A0A364L2X0_TALAM|nr:uncharacterized protein BHQ10_006162 [Talaromyces amestolkiae]RAO70150.1 hypothetical protein BHQ10_006162 [Talaromyces amestolkiae]